MAGTMLVLGLLLSAGAARGREAIDGRSQHGRVLVKVWDRAPVPAADWARARQAVTEAFRTAGLEVGWLACAKGADPACSCPAGPGEIGLRIFRPLPEERRRAGHSTAGAAFDTDAERGQGIAYVYFDRIEDVAREAGLPSHLVLGMTAAHEIGHVLLPPGHSPSGIMQANLGRQDWKQAERGWLGFDPSDAARMRERSVGWTERRGPFPSHPGEWIRHIY